MKFIKYIIAAALSLGIIAPMAVLAVDNTTQQQITQGICSVDSTHCSQNNFFGAGGTFARVGDLLIFLIAAISILMVIIGGLRYTLSGGDPGSVKGAKDTILYAIIGIVVAALSYAAVHFVITNVTK